jgi:putative SOS response-associated peptidase YedK
MCGRYRLSRSKEALARHFGVDPDEVDWEPRYNIAPTQQVCVVRQDRKEPVRHASMMRWGLIPSWAKDPSIGARTINARAETVAARPAFRESLERRRCLIPADGFYEWKRSGKAKQPFCFEVEDGKLFAFAGLWDRWRSPDGNPLESCTILTTTSNRLMADIHDRMPVILPADDYDLWLDPGMTDSATAVDLLKPYDAALMRDYPVSARVNAVTNDDAECSMRIHVSQSAPSLFD